MRRPLITSGIGDADVPYIDRGDLLDCLSLREISSLDDFMRDTDAARPHVPGSTRNNVFPWVYIQWRKWYDEEQASLDNG